MDAVAAVLDERVEFFDSRLPAVIELARRSRQEAAGAYGENQSVKRCGVFVVEGAIDEYVVRRGGGL